METTYIFFCFKMEKSDMREVSWDSGALTLSGTTAFEFSAVEQ